MDEEQKQIIYKISEALTTLDNNIITTPIPTNLETELEKFSNSSINNPVFSYKDKNLDLKLFGNISSDIEDMITSSKLEEESKKYFLANLDYLKNNFNAAYYIGKDDDEFYKYHKELYPLVEFVEFTPVLSKRTTELFGAEYIKNYFEEVLKLNEVEGLVQIVIDNDRKAKIGVGKDGKVIISGNISRTREDIERLAVHEVLTHSLRLINNKDTKLPHIEKRLAKDYLLFEEGLAVFNEVCSKTITEEAWNKYILRYNLITKPQTNSFRDIYNNLKDLGQTDATAFETVYRIKRGLIDTSTSKFFRKDTLYYRGFHVINDAIKAKSNEHRDLYIGKVTFRDIEFIKSIFGVVSPKFLPSFLK
ncbi:MAG: tyrosine/phenylalanine carboxypeptidase domain-containing protein [Candidatus Dojkabacteria bacterium]